MTHIGPHLNDEQFAECAVLAIGPDCERHLAQCARCRGELDTFRTSVGVFNQASMAWSEAQPSVSLRGLAKSRARRAALVPVGWALATAAVLAVAVPVVNHQHHASDAGNAAAFTSQEDSVAQIAEDDRLMQSVNVALAANEASQLDEYGLSSDSLGPTKLVKGPRRQ